jgi:hypothetical protein
VSFGVFCCLGTLAFAQTASSDSIACIDCHSKKTPTIVSDWKLSKHSTLNTACGRFKGRSTPVRITRSGMGRSEMQRDLTEIRELAAQMRQNKKGAAVSQLRGRAWEGNAFEVKWVAAGITGRGAVAKSVLSSLCFCPNLLEAPT